jgi:hypothetical protein
MKKTNTFRESILECIEICNEEVKLRNEGIEGESTILQIQGTIIPELNHLLELVDAGNFPPKKERYLTSYANALFMTWDWDKSLTAKPNKLFDKLSELDKQYKKLST